MIRALVSDFGGVLTTPLTVAFTRAHDQMGIPLEALRRAMALLASRHPEPPLFTLERGQMSEPEFMALLQGALGEILGREVAVDGYGARLMGAMERNERLLGHYRRLRDERGLRLAILTNNVREWQPRWMPLLPDGLFELIVDSAFVGMRKPEPEIYELTLARLGLPGSACAFLDDVEVNVLAARDAGLHAIHFRDTDQAIADLDALLAGTSG